MRRNESRARRTAALTTCLIVIALLIAGCAAKRPQVASTSPNPGASNVPATPPVVQITFDGPMDRESVENAIMITPSAGGTPNYSWSNDDKTVTVNYSQPFAPSTTYTVMVMKDAAAANKAPLGEDYEFKFATAPAPMAAPAPPPPPPSGATPSTGTAPPKQQPAKPTQPPATQPSESTGAGTGRGSSAAVTFTKDIKPVADARCKQCHQDKMSNYDNIIAKKLVVSGESGQSPYYTKAAGKTAHPGGNAWKDKADVVKAWIDAGAAK